MFEFMISVCTCVHGAKGQLQDRQSLIGLKLTRLSRLSHHSLPWSAFLCLYHLILHLRYRFSSLPGKHITNSHPSSAINLCAWGELRVEIYPSGDWLAAVSWAYMGRFAQDTHVTLNCMCLGATVSVTVLMSWIQWLHLIFWAWEFKVLNIFYTVLMVHLKFHFLSQHGDITQ